jgi:hypothetical protein
MLNDAGITNMARMMLMVCEAAERYNYCEVEILKDNSDVWMIRIELSYGSVEVYGNTQEEAAGKAITQWPSDEA